MLFRKNKFYKMNENLADSTLQNILSACEKTPGEISLSSLPLHWEPSLSVYNRLLAVTACLLLLTVLAPFALLLPASAPGNRSLHREVTLTENYVSENKLYLSVSGDNILYEEAYLETADGTILLPESYDASRGLLCFPYVSDMESNIYIPVKDSAPLHLLLTPQ